MTERRGQASLEFVLVLAAFLAALALIFPALFQMADGLQWWNEVGNAQDFAQQIQDKSDELSLFGDGTEFEVHASPQSAWTISAGGKTLKLEAARKNSAKSFERTLALDAVPFQQSFDTAFTLRLRKENGSIVFETR